MIDISLLRVLSTRKGFDKLYGAIPQKAMEKRTVVLIADIARYFKTFTEHESVDFVQFRDLFKVWHPTLDAEQLTYYNKVIGYAEKNLDVVSHNTIVNSMLELQYAADVAEALEKYNDGEEIDIIRTLESITERTTAAQERRVDDNWINPDIDELVEEDDRIGGLSFRLECLNDNIKELQGGDFIIVAGRPDTGKTSFLTSELSFMVPQIEDDRPVLWCNNEGDGKRILRRMIQSTLNITPTEMVALSQQKQLAQQYAAAHGGKDRFRIIDIHEYWNWQVEELIEQHNPKVLVLDMIDNIKFQGMSLGGGARTDQILEEMYKWGRNQAVKHDMIVIATSQISADGEGMQFPTKDMLKDSKTGKQGAADLMLMIGRSNDPMLQQARFLSTPKNKLRKVGHGDPQKQVYFDLDRGRYNQ